MKKINFSLQKIKKMFLNINKKTALFVILGFAGIFLIFFSEINIWSSDSQKEKNSEADDSSYSSEEYCCRLENKVREIVEAIDGAGETRVMITLSETTEYIYATNDKDVRKNSSNSQDVNSQNDYVIMNYGNNDSGLLLKTIEPKIRGVAVVCEGGGNAKVQEQIYSAVGAVLNISTSRISISKLSVTEEKSNEK